MEMNDENNNNDIHNDDVGTPTNEFIASYIWGAGHICACYYNTFSLELFVTHETVDLKPDYWHLKNLFRQINVRNVLASGPNQFLSEVMQLLNISNSLDPSPYRLNRLKNISLSKFIVYTNNEKTLFANRKRILNMELPRMLSTFSEQDRFNFIETILPLHQNLIVQCLGNLLNYLDANWKYLFLRPEIRPIITDIHVHRLDTQVLIDDATFNAMQIFASKDHPSAFKKCTGIASSSREGLSIFKVINSCVSRLGTNELKTWLQQPSRDLNELTRRFRLIEWCRNEKNATHLSKIRCSLKKINNVGELYAKLISTHGKPNVWKAFKRSIYYANNIGNLCAGLVKAKIPGIDNTVVEHFGKYTCNNSTFEDVLMHLNIIIDLEESLKIGKFCTKYGLDPDLDGNKNKLQEVIAELLIKAKDELASLPEFVHEVTVHFVTELGFLVAFPTMGIDSLPTLNTENYKLVYKTKDALFFTTPICVALNEKYGHLYVDICEREQQICDRLLQHIHEHLADLQYAIRFCAQIDCIMALATFSLNYNLTKPELLIDQKVLEIVNGRHILLDLQKKFIPHETAIAVDKKNLINILIAPNASGKSVYLKELAQITYLAHIGSFVPAVYAKIPVVDAIYTRIYSPESLFLAKSSFLIEIQQMSTVIMNSSTQSLILVDELGQGTNATDGKALLLSCLEHLISRGDKAPITVITTHYVDIYDAMINREWVAMKTFEMSRCTDGSILSTFKIFDGKCVENYAKDCAIIRRFSKRAIVTNEDTRKTTSVISDSTATEFDYTTIMQFANSIYNSRIECAASILKGFLEQSLSANDSTNLLNVFFDWDSLKQL